MKKSLWILCLAAVLVLAACAAKPPQEKIDAAKVAMDEAKKAEADTFAPDAYKALVDKDAAMQAALTEKKYEDVAKMADEVKTLSATAVADAQKGKDQVKADALAAVDAAGAAVIAAEEALAKAPTGKGSAADLEAMKGDVEAAKKSVEEAKAANEAGKFTEAKTAADAAKVKAETVTAAVQAAIDAKAGAKKK